MCGSSLNLNKICMCNTHTHTHTAYCVYVLSNWFFVKFVSHFQAANECGTRHNGLVFVKWNRTCCVCLGEPKGHCYPERIQINQMSRNKHLSCRYIIATLSSLLLLVSFIYCFSRPFYCWIRVYHLHWRFSIVLNRELKDEFFFLKKSHDSIQACMRWCNDITSWNWNHYTWFNLWFGKRKYFLYHQIDINTIENHAFFIKELHKVQ